MKYFTKLIYIFLLFINILVADEVPNFTGNVINDNLIREYTLLNESVPDEEVSLIEIINSSELYKTITGNAVYESDKGMLNRLIEITDVLEEKGSVLVTLKLQGKFYPEGTLNEEYKVQDQRQKFIDILVPIILDKMLDEQEMLDSIHIYDSVPYFTLTLNKNNFWKLLDSKGIIDIELVKLNEPMLAESIPLVGANLAWNAGADGDGQVVAVLDTGVRKTHEFLTGKVVSEACYSNAGGFGSGISLCPGGVTATTATNSGLNCNTSYSACHHGTHVAGIVAGKGNSFSGVAKEANIIAMQVFTNIGGKILSYGSDQTRGLERVYALRNTYSIASANMSIGGGSYTSYCNNDSRKAIIDNLLSVGIATIISSGNDGYTNAVGSPGCIETAVTVGATSDGGWSRVQDSVDSYSNSASMVDILAPGSAITSSTAGSNTQYQAYQGTSMAAPHVAGAFAVLKSAKSDITVNEALAILQSTGKDITDSKNGLVKKRINVDTAVNALGSADVTVTISTAGAISDGAQWKIDNGSWQNSGATVNEVLVGSHTISFKSISHSNNDKVWVTPSSISINIASDGDNKNESTSYIESDKKANIVDYNGDGKSDLLLRNTDGSYFLYFMDGNVMASYGAVQTSSGQVAKPPVNMWTTNGLGDFNGDGKSDLLLRNTDGSYFVYFMDGNIMASYGAVQTSLGQVAKPPVSMWSTEGLGDFNGDGKSDLLLRNTDGSYFVYFMDGNVMASYGAVQTSLGQVAKPPRSMWSTEGLGDFNGDGKSDLLLRNANDGSYFVYFMDGNVMASYGAVQTSSGQVAKPPRSMWSTEGLGDFNGDGKSDLLLRNANDGSYFVYFMDGNVMTSYGAVQTSSGQVAKPPVSMWTTNGLGDFNGDGKNDLLLRSTDGSYFVYFMDGNVMASYGAVQTSSGQVAKPPVSMWTTQ